MSLVAAIRDMLAKGWSIEQALAAAELVENREEARRVRKKAKEAAEAAAAAAKEEARRAKEAARLRQYRERKKAERTRTNADEHVRTAHTSTPLKQKEPSPPTPPLLEKLNSPRIVSDETIVDEVVDVSDFNDLAKARKGNVELFQTIVGLWNDLASSHGLVAVRDITTKRQSAILARSEDLVKTYDFPDALEGWRKLMGLVRGSPFLRGEATGFRCDFDFVSRASSFTKIMEGKYEAKTTPPRWKGR
jgi:hypothetical protein